MNIPELLSPAGNFEKMKAALRFGADAVYLAGNCFGMRSAADNFTNDELREAVAYAHERGKKVYLTVNTMPRGYEYPRLREYLTDLRDCPFDAMIVADLGVFATIREILPDMEIHISTQASAVSAPAVRALASLGAKRIVLARELTIEEVRAIRDDIPDEIELEAFVHGSMCVSYSGRCLLSNHFTGRDGNRGACAQPCRWNYTYTITEEKRPETPMPLEEHEHGTFILSSKDMCTIEHIPALCQSGINSFKIEGRMKSAYYTAVVTNAYRMALDAYAADPEGYVFDPIWLRELESVSHREYDTGFWFDRSNEDAKLSTIPGYLREKAYFATASAMDGVTVPDGLEAENENGRLYLFLQRNKMCVGDAAELVSPRRPGKPFTAQEMYNIEGEAIPACPHPYMQFFLRVPFEVHEGDILRAGDGEK